MSDFRYKPYPNFFGTGQPWLPDLPVGWQAISLKHLTEGRVQDGPHETPVFTESGVPFFSVDGIQDNELVFEGCRFISVEDHERFAKKCRPRKGDVLLGKAASVGKVAHVRTDVEFNVWSPLAVIRPRSDSYGRFIYYVIQSCGTQAQCLVFSNANTQNNLSMGSIQNLTVPCPSEREAIQIAAFLDHETAKIDALIARQQELIALLKEKRQAVISHAVTRGLNPDVKLRDSGVEWLGQVPEHWEVARINKFSSKITNGYVGPTRGLFVDEGVKYIQSLHIKDNRVRFTPTYYVTAEWSETKQKSILRAGDVLVVQTGDVGQSACVPDRLAGANCHALIVIATIQEVVTGPYLAWCLNSDYGVNVLKSIQTGALHPHLNCGTVKYLSIPIPPVDEQESIVEFVEAERLKYGDLQDRCQTQIDLLQERRSALISAAVTGKIDVRQWDRSAAGVAS